MDAGHGKRAVLTVERSLELPFLLVVLKGKLSYNPKAFQEGCARIGLEDLFCTATIVKQITGVPTSMDW